MKCYVSILFSFCIACSHGTPAAHLTARRPTESSAKPNASVYSELARARLTRDSVALRGLAGGDRGEALRAQPTSRRLLADALFEVLGPAEAGGDYDAVCRVESALPELERKTACARAQLAVLSKGNAVLGAGEVAFLDGQAIPLVQLAVNGKPPTYFIVDTGAPTTVVTEYYANLAGIVPDRAYAETASDGGSAAVMLTPHALDSIALGNAVSRRAPVNVIALPSNFKLGGILAPHFTFRGRAIAFDFHKRRLEVLDIDSLTAKSESAFEATLLWSGGNPFVEVVVDGTKGYFLLDTGAGADFMCNWFAEATGHGTELAEQTGTRGTAAVGTVEVKPGVDVALRVGGEEPATHRLMFHDCPEPGDENPGALRKAGYLGLPWMAGRRLVISADQRKLTFTAPVAAAPQSKAQTRTRAR